MDFPQYRKLDQWVYYRINSERSFDEIRLMGSNALFHTIEANQYPEILRIKDMLDLNIEHLSLSDAEEFDSIRDRFGL